MFRHLSVDRWIVVVSVIGVLLPIARGVADSIDDGRAARIVSAATTTSAGCVVAEPRFPVVVEVPVTVWAPETLPSVRAEVVSIGTGGRVVSGADVDMVVDIAGRATATVTWRGGAWTRRVPVGTYEVVVMSASGRSATCVNVARPVAAKETDRVRPPQDPGVEVIIIGRSEQREGAR